MLFFVLLSLLFSVDTSAMKLQDDAFNRAMISFGLAKGLNAVISLIQGTELSFTPVGIGLNFSVGEVLDPFNDMVERFSWVMLLASISLGVQKLLLIVSGKLFLQLVLYGAIASSLILLWIKKYNTTRLFAYSLKFVAFLLILRFSAIFFIYSSEFLYTSLLKNEYTQASSIVTSTKHELDALQNKNKQIMQAQKEEGFFNKLHNDYNTVMSSLNLSTQLAALQESVDKASRSIITLITLFVVQSILFPLLYVWLTILLVKYIFHIPFNAQKLKLLYNTSIKNTGV